MKKFFTLIVAIVAMASMQAETLTVSDGNSLYINFPIWMCDNFDYVDNDGVTWTYTQEGSITQMIYPADLLSAMVNGDISQIKFHPSFPISFYGGNVELSFLIVDFTNFNDENRCYQYGAAPVANGTMVQEATELVFDLDQPYHYTGGNLLIQAKITESITLPAAYSDWYSGTDCSVHSSIRIHEIDLERGGAYWIGESSRFLPKATFTYEAGTTPVEPTQKTGAPVFNGYTTDGIHAYFVEITPTEPSTIYYRVLYPDGTQTDWAEYSEILSFVGNGKYRVEAYAVAPGKLESDSIAYEFVVSPVTGLSEMASGKTVAGVRYFNAMGQEMQEANGLTIAVTTYTDGTTSSVKVVK